jgi:fermentation-respiration switch protein FrsA (DUF1100 family)
MRKAIVFFLSALVLLMAGSAWVALYPTVPADLGGVANLDPHAALVRIAVGEGDHLDGWFLKGRHPAVVLLFAGYARDHRRMWRYAGFMNRMGLNVLTIDFRSARATSRKPTTLGYWELRDARAALDWVREQPGLADARVALYGESLGGAAALALAAQRPDVAAVVADCPFETGEAAIEDGFRCVLHLPAQPLTWIARQVGRLVTGHDPGAQDVTQALRSMGGRPVLLIQTRLGDRFSAQQVDRLTASLGLYGESWTLDDVKHTEAWLHHRDEYERRVGRFLGERLGLAPATARPVARATSRSSAPAPARARKRAR